MKKLDKKVDGQISNKRNGCRLLDRMDEQINMWNDRQVDRRVDHWMGQRSR